MARVVSRSIVRIEIMLKIKFFLIVICLVTPLVTLGQNGEIKATLKFENATLEQVIKDIEVAYSRPLSYSSNALPLEQRVTCHIKNGTIYEVLNQVGNQLPIGYRIVNNQIVLRYIELKQTVRGTVVDQASQQPVIGATIIIMNGESLLGSATDVDGKFKVENVPVGRRTVKVTNVGYEDRIIPSVLVGTGKEVVLNIDLVESVTQIDEITIVDEGISSLPVNEMAMVSSRSFTVEETKRFPASVGDPLRLASSFAGVVSSDDESNEIVVRGNTPRGILWKLEGVEIPSPNHFSSEGTSSGGISMFSTQVISRSDFFTGAFAPEYGNATSGVFDIHLRNGNNEKSENTVQLGFLGADIASEGPFVPGKQSSYLFNYRYSTLAILSKLGLEIQDEGETNVFQDLSLKLNFPTRTAGTFSVFGLGGLSSAKQQLNLELDQEDYNLGLLGLSHQINIGTTGFLRTTLSMTGTQLKDNFVFSPDQNYHELKQLNKSYSRASFLFNKKFNSRNLLETGVTITQLSYNFSGKYLNQANTPPYNEFDTFEDEGKSGTEQAYVSWKFRVTDDLSLVNGLHALRFDLNGETSVEPRSSLKWQFKPDKSLFAGYGLHSRIESLEYYFGNFLEADGATVDYNRNLGFSKSNHYVAGFDWQINDQVYFRSEVYYQNLFNIPVIADSSRSFISVLNLTDGYTPLPLVNKGTGKNYGIELTFERKFADSYYYLINTSIYESKYKTLDGVERDTRYNGNFVVNALAGKEYKVGMNGRNNIFGMSAKLNYAGNKRYTPISIAESQKQNREVRLEEYAYSERYPDHFRLDVQFSFRKNRARTTSELRLDIQNLTNRKNILGDFYRPGGIGQVEGLGLIPVLSYRLEF